MPRFALPAALLLLSTLAHAQIPTEESFWTPDAALIARLEAGLKIESFPGETETHYDFAQYDRYYYGATLRGHRIVRGVLILPSNREDHPKPGVHITEKQYMPRLHGGGCAHVSVQYFVDNNSSSTSCDVLDSAAPPSEEPHWTPDEATVARMEAGVQDRMHRAGIADLDGYSRYYVGVTLNEKPMIRGRIIKQRTGASAPNPGIRDVHLASQWDDASIVFDGGCDNIRLIYDVKAQKFTELTCNEQGGAGKLKPQD